MNDPNSNNQAVCVLGLDHVAIRTNDLELAAAWYERVLGLRRFQPMEWKPYPIFLISGKSGIALFPADENNALQPNGIRIDHFAFRVDRENFARAKSRLIEMGIPFQFQNHTYFESIYFRDLDRHLVELTTCIVDERSIYDLPATRLGEKS